ncbi:MAG: hypothetical protein U5K75_02215 [Ahrensia sp.]|nr:hypothetical protein [Ahrensia sp.]
MRKCSVLASKLSTQPSAGRRTSAFNWVWVIKIKSPLVNALAAAQMQHKTIEAGRDTDFHGALGAASALATVQMQDKTIDAGRDTDFHGGLIAGSAFLPSKSCTPHL